MKKLVMLLAICVCMLSLCGCGNKDREGMSVEKLKPIMVYDTHIGTVYFYDINGELWVEYDSFDTEMFYPVNKSVDYIYGVEGLAVGDTDDGV